jgi:hypothetical protein
MARYTRAYSSFVSRLDEVETLRKFALQKERTDPIGLRKGINALCRGALVLLSGHLEAYVRDIGELALTSMTAKGVLRKNVPSRLYYYISQDLLTELKDTADPERIADKVFAFIGSDLMHWSKSGTFQQPIQAERFNKGFASPAFPKIKQYFNRFGYDTYAKDLSGRLRAEYLPTVNMVNHLVDTRNKIAHGDPAASKTPAEVGTMISLTRIFCGSTDAVFAEWWKSSFCSIR